MTFGLVALFQGERGRHIRGRVQRTLLHGTSVVADFSGVQAKGRIQKARGYVIRGEGRE